VTSAIEARNRHELVVAVEQGVRPSYCFFWGHHAHDGAAVGKWCLSQWWPVPFVVDGITYPSAEHYMMAGKARLFRDERTLREILAAPSPAAAKKLGRAVQGFDESVWRKHRSGLVVGGNLAKFGQHAELRSLLLGIEEDVIVEASPRDTIWGIGMGAANPAARDPRRWRGENLLGFALMEVRARLHGGP
jgi:ribA/ribD-fused uncharacterized protein